MKSNMFLTLVCTIILGVSAVAVAEQPYMVPSNAAIAVTTAPTKMSNSDVRHEIQSRFDIDLEFNGTLMYASVTDDSVRLDGWVYTKAQRDLAKDVAEFFAGDRKVLENIQTGGLPGW